MDNQLSITDFVTDFLTDCYVIKASYRVNDKVGNESQLPIHDSSISNFYRVIVTKLFQYSNGINTLLQTSSFKGGEIMVIDFISVKIVHHPRNYAVLEIVMLLLF